MAEPSWTNNQIAREVAELNLEPDWKNLALHLLNCTAATATGFPKSISKSERRRHRSILKRALSLLNGDPPSCQEDQEWITRRARDAVVYLDGELNG